ncbi:MAG: type II toxin-antitoxin system HicA family toxin [Ignavibacteria bacterium]|nr:type II toxin-antitoxin system HicA family toxin [Ignavibacteria bacterium]
MRIPRDLSGEKLIKSLKKFGYLQTRQTGSHIRLTRVSEEGEHHITVPNHSPLKIGTLNNILQEIATHLSISKEELLNKL